MKILVLGGTGYLGKRVIQTLLSKSATIYCTTRNIEEHKSRKNLTYISSNEKEINNLLANTNIEVILNMACSYDGGLLLYNNVVESNISFPLQVLNLAARYEIKYFYTIGTGLPNDFNIYSLSKKCFSEFGEFYFKKHGINFTTIKLEMFYGEDEPRDRFISNVTRKMLNNEEIDLTVGTQKRDIIYVEDVSDAIYFLINLRLKGYNTIPVGTGEAPTIREIIEYIYEYTNSKSTLNFGKIPLRVDEPSCISDTKKISQLGYKVKFNWKIGLAHMIDCINKTEVKTII